ncbi:MAG: ClpXP protease specificity-enhancing factor [Gammaproteobacteria bacterium]|nr:ClpXP protease specificity-enhancing factor [Gammaproteobacteria bacterium]
MTPTRPYLLRAMHQWIIDNDLTPYILVDATRADVQVPQAYVADGKIVLNISMTAVRDLELSNACVTFGAKFRGNDQYIYVPIAAVEAIYAKENGQGMVFNDEIAGGEPPPSDNSTPPGRPRLTVVK